MAYTLDLKKTDNEMEAKCKMCQTIHLSNMGIGAIKSHANERNTF